jgi:hypothetical protein
VENQPLLSRTLLATLLAMAPRLEPANEKIKNFLAPKRVVLLLQG